MQSKATVKKLYKGRSPPMLTDMRVLSESSDGDHQVMEFGMNFLTGDDMSAVLQTTLRKSIGFGMTANKHITGITPTLGHNKKNRSFYTVTLICTSNGEGAASGFECTGCCKNTAVPSFTALVIAGMGFFTDAYDLFCISLVTKLLGRIYYRPWFITCQYCCGG
ncbi:C2 domain-containing protein [Carex littledalei]|uniref:C2 domain-containing protein n=1 Tax=Carex littledalei TaxID=544730 RepID=A0A833VP14_9POAL|nr:C2 domain-containing protein [Carex littledalei]